MDCVYLKQVASDTFLFIVKDNILLCYNINIIWFMHYLTRRVYIFLSAYLIWRLI